MGKIRKKRWRSMYDLHRSRMRRWDRDKTIFFGNLVDIMTCGGCIYDEMLKSIQNARRYVWLESYIYVNDSVGKMFRQALIDAAKRGCEVVLNCDYIGSIYLNSLFLNSLREAGVRVILFNSLEKFASRGFKSFFFRNHRKLLIVDETIAFCGSANIINNKKKHFRDTAIKITGPMGHGLKENVYNTFYKLLEAKIIRTAPRCHYSRNGVFLKLYECNKAFKIYTLPDLIMMALRFSKKYCYFTTPYFDPFSGIKYFILDAARRGVRVRILVAGVSDVPFMRMASKCIYDEYLDVGVEIYEVYGNMLHAKTAIFDNQLALIGSFNLDCISLNNLELNLGIFDQEGKVREIMVQFCEDLKKSKKIRMRFREEPFFMRIICKICFYLLRLYKRICY